MRHVLQAVVRAAALIAVGYPVRPAQPMRLPSGIRPLLHLPKHILPEPLLRKLSQERLLLRVLELLGHLQARAAGAPALV